MSIDLNKSSADLLDNMRLTKTSRIQKEIDYLKITSVINSAVKKVGGVNWEVAKYIKENLTGVSKEFLLEVLVYLGYKYSSVQFFKRNLKGLKDEF